MARNMYSDVRRHVGGRLVRQTWVAWAEGQDAPKPSWLVPWKDLDADQREVDMRIADALRAPLFAEIESLRTLINDALVFVELDLLDDYGPVSRGLTRDRVGARMRKVLWGEAAS